MILQAVVDTYKVESHVHSNSSIYVVGLHILLSFIKPPHPPHIQAHSRGYVYPYYTWILYGWYSNNWWEMSESRDCSNIMISEVLERAVSIQVYPMPTDYDSTTDTGFVSAFSYCIYSLECGVNIHMVFQAMCVSWLVKKSIFCVSHSPQLVTQT